MYPAEEEKVPIRLTKVNFLFLQYSMAFFFDMDNPAVAEDFEEEDDEDEFEVEFYNGLDDEVDVYALLDSEEGEDGPYDDGLEWKNELLYSNLSPDESGMVFVKENELIRVVLTGTTQVISEFEIESGKLLYVVEDYDDEDDEDDYLHEDEFKVKLRNEFPEKVDIKLREKGTEVWKYMFENMEVNYIAVEGDEVKVLKGGTESILLDIKIKRSKSLYAFSRDNLNDWHTEL